MNGDDRAALKLAADVFESLPTVLLAELGRRGTTLTAAATQMGLDRQTVSRWVNGHTRPQADDVVILFRWLADGATR